MSVRYKLALIFTSVFILAGIPLSLYVTGIVKSEKIEASISQGAIFSQVSAHTSLKTLLMNGGDIDAARIDSTTHLKMFSPMHDRGLIYADTFLIAPGKKLHCSKVSELRAGMLPVSYMAGNKLDDCPASGNSSSGEISWREITIPGLTGSYIETSSIASVEGLHIKCAGRMIFSKDSILQPVNNLIRRIYSVIIAVLAAVAGLAFFSSGLITTPVKRLLAGVKKIEQGEFSHRVEVSGKDELATLASAFNGMSLMVSEKITELETLNKELTRMNIIKDEFLANTSHELKTPLNGIIGISESLMDRAEDMPGCKEDLALIAQSGRRLSNLVNDILDFSRIRNRDIELNRKKVIPAPVAGFICDVFSRSMMKKGVNLINNISPGLPPVYADENRLQQIMFNLIGNAVKFTHHGSVAVDASPSGGFLEFRISDTGIGIPHDKIDAVFNPFEQADGSISRRYGGTGLGLAITKNIVELHGGSIHAESTPGAGSVFSFTIPVFSDGDTASAEPDFVDEKRFINEEVIIHDYPDSETENNFHGTILAVDDEPVNLRVIYSILTREGFSVVTKPGGREALEYIESNAAPDLILLDIMMPDVNGYEVCETIRLRHRLFNVPVLMLTAKNQNEDILISFKSGANDFIAKPFEKEVLTARVKNLITLKKSAEREQELIYIRDELKIANEIQRSILPSVMPAVSGLSVNAEYIPADEIGGDFFDFHISPEGALGIIIADVTGHGVPAALIASMLKIAYSQSDRKIPAPDSLLSAMNRILFKNHSGQIITSQAAYIDPADGMLTVSNAGHWPAAVINRTTGELQLVSSRGIPLCMLAETQYTSIKVNFAPGDRLVMFTDGILEAENEKHEILGEERFLTMMKNLRNEPGELFIKNLIAQTTAWTCVKKGTGFTDDVCIICIDRE